MKKNCESYLFFTLNQIYIVFNVMLLEKCLQRIFYEKYVCGKNAFFKLKYAHKRAYRV